MTEIKLTQTSMKHICTFDMDLKRLSLNITFVWEKRLGHSLLKISGGCIDLR